MLLYMFSVPLLPSGISHFATNFSASAFQHLGFSFQVSAFSCLFSFLHFEFYRLQLSPFSEVRI